MKHFINYITVLLMIMVFPRTYVRAEQQPIGGNNLVATQTEAEKNTDKKLTDPTNQRSKPRRRSSAPDRKLDAFKKAQSKELLRETSKLGLGLGVVGGIGYVIGGSQLLNFSTIMSSLLGDLLTQPIRNISSRLCILFVPALVKPSLQKAINLRKQFLRRRAGFTTSMQIFLDACIEQYMYRIQNFDYVDKYTERAIEEILQFPTEPKKIEPDIARITNFLKSYPTTVRTAMGDFVVNTIVDSKLKQLAKKSTPIMFVGPPGTGKTYLAKEIGKRLGLPTHIVDLSRYKNVNGSSYWYDDPDKGILVDILLGERNKGTNFSNKIVILDEVDKVLSRDKNGSFIHPSGPAILTFLHTLLERQETTSNLARYYNASHDISQLKIILIGNHTFTEVLGEDQAMALESRVTIVTFGDGFQEGQKLSIAREYLMTRCQIQGWDYNQIDQGIIEGIVKADKQAGYKGVRVMLDVIDQYLRVLDQGALISQVAGIPVAFNIEQAYKQHLLSSQASKDQPSE